MIKRFKSQLEGMNFILNNSEDETEFETQRENLLFNYIYTGKYWIELWKNTFKKKKQG